MSTDSVQISAYNAATLFAEHSRSNNYMAHELSFFLYSQGATRQLISVFNHLGQCMSYQTIAGRGGKTLADSDTEDESTDSESDEATGNVRHISTSMALSLL